MIAAWYKDHELIRTFGPPEFIAELVELGVAIRRIDRPAESGVALLFAELEAAIVFSMSADARSRTVLVSEGGGWNDDWEARRQALGLLGVVESMAWSRWQGGKYQSWGLYGRADIASAAGLTMSSKGLRTPDGEPLPELLAPFLLAAERVLGTGTTPT
jgi:hypothetical protein